MRLEITAAAYQDLDEIEAYTTRTWGPRQAERYLDALYAALDRIMENPAQLLRGGDLESRLATEAELLHRKARDRKLP